MNKYFYILLLFCICSFFRLSAVENDGSRYTSNSVLSTGNWSKIKVPATGVYKLTYDELVKMGLSNPKNVKIYGYGGWVLDEDFTKPYVDDLPQVSIWMSKEPANFGKGDYILFYARGGIKWVYDEKLKEFVRHQNTYSKNSDNKANEVAYYFVTESTDEPKLINNKASLAGVPIQVNSFDDYYLHEKELVNVAETGREFFGETFMYKTSQNFTLPLEGITADRAIIRYNFISRAMLSVGTLGVSANGGVVKKNITGIVSDYYLHGTTINDTIVRSNLSNKTTVNLNYTKGYSTDQNLYLNYLLVNYKRTLKSYGAVTLFRDITNRGNVQFNISEAKSSMQVWDVTDNTTVSKIDANFMGSSLSFGASNTDIREYALIDISEAIPSPTVVGKVANQNLHGLTSADMIILVQPFLKQYAQQIAQLHEQDGLTSLVVSAEDIYNEFSSGNPDVTAYRRFLKMFYDRGTSESDRPKYLLLFGGGTYDNRFIQNGWTDENKKSMLLTYQTKESLDERNSYVTDDYMGFLDDNEGLTLAYDKLDLSIGRIPVRTEKDAQIAVSKIATYMSNANKGIWENNITFIADDAIASTHSQSSERAHMVDAEKLANYIEDTHPDFILNRIYLDNYERVVESYGARYPDAAKAITDQINKGTLALNFIGHGATDSWTHEFVLTQSDIINMQNDKLPLWITATCDFSRFDANKTSGGESALLNPNGGAIALLSTVRVVLIVDNAIMNTNITKHLLVEQNGKPARFGDIIRNAKLENNMIGDDNKLKFLLIGDPALRLNYPPSTYRVEVSEMNGLAADEKDINIKALDNTTIKGHIVNKNGEIVTDFNGVLESVIFDAEQTLKTRGNTPKGEQSDEVAMSYKDYPNALFSGRVEVVDGSFEINFIASKDILHTDGKGKMSFYAYSVEGDKEAQGSFFNYTVGGTNTNMPQENNPPIISAMYLNSPAFKNGDYVNPNPLFIADVSDDTGINMSSGINHNMSIILDNYLEIDMTPFFVNEENSNKKGRINYPLLGLSEGYHSLELTVWDVWNNSTSQLIQFYVGEETQPAISEFVIWGNPAREEADFRLTSNSVGEDVKIKLSVYSLTGVLMWVHEGRPDYLQYSYRWNLNGSGGGRLYPGVYICTAQISVNGRYSKLKSQKLIVSP